MLPKKIDFNFTNPQNDIVDVVQLLRERYRAYVNNVMFEQSTAMFFPPKVRLEVEMDAEKLSQLHEDMKKALTTPLYASMPIHFPSLDYETRFPVAEVSEVPDDRPCMRCTKEQKEKFISMVETYCDTCFLDDCEAQDDYDCRKCLERKVRWELTD